jgi:hypothetical protein
MWRRIVRWYLSSSLHSITSQRNEIVILNAAKVLISHTKFRAQFDFQWKNDVDIKFVEHPSSGSLFETCGRRDRPGILYMRSVHALFWRSHWNSIRAPKSLASDYKYIVTLGLTARLAVPAKQPIARQRQCKQAAILEPSLGNKSASSNGGTARGGVFYAVLAEALQKVSFWICRVRSRRLVSSE